MGGAIIALLAVVLFVALILFRLIEVTFIRLGRARAAGLDEASGDELQLADLISDREVLLAPVTILRIISQVGLIVLAMNIGRSAGGTLLSVAVATFVLFLLGEAIPRRWAIEANDEMAKWLSRPARVIARLVPLQLIARPLAVLVRRFGPRSRQEELDPVVEDELVALAEAAAEASLIEDDEAHLIGSIIELGDTIVREVMVPRPDMVTLEAHLTVSEALAVVVDTGFTRLFLTSKRDQCPTEEGASSKTLCQLFNAFLLSRLGLFYPFHSFPAPLFYPTGTPPPPSFCEG